MELDTQDDQYSKYDLACHMRLLIIMFGTAYAKAPTMLQTGQYPQSIKHVHGIKCSSMLDQYACNWRVIQAAKLLMALTLKILIIQMHKF